MNCVFCKIVSGEIPSRKVYEDDRVLAFYDIEPAAPVHFLVIPKDHELTGVSGITEENADMVAHIFTVIARLTRELGLTDYRVVTNNGPKAGQTVSHLHFHVLSGGNLDLLSDGELGPMA